MYEISQVRSALSPRLLRGYFFHRWQVFVVKLSEGSDGKVEFVVRVADHASRWEKEELAV